MRLLIGFYVAQGVICLGAVVLIAFIAMEIEAKAADKPRHRISKKQMEELNFMIPVMAGVSALPSIAAVGLWRRWRMVRLVLLGLSWWSIALAIVIAMAGLGHHLRLIDASAWLGREPLVETLGLSAAIIAFYGWHLWVLMRSDIRQSFQRSLSSARAEAAEGEQAW